MIKPVKQAFLKEDLFKISVPTNGGVYNKKEVEEEIEEMKNLILQRHIASKGTRFVYCETDRRDGRHGWYADDNSGYFREGNLGFGKMSEKFAEKYLTEPEPFVPKKHDQLKQAW